MSATGDKIKDAIDRHNASIETARNVAKEIAAEREAAISAGAYPSSSPDALPQLQQKEEPGQ